MEIPFPEKVDAEDFARKAFGVIVGHLKKRKDNENALSIIAAGASFEQWMSFESRLALENSRVELPNNEVINMTEEIISKSKSKIPRYWIENEHGKVDLLIGQCLGNSANGDEYFWDDGKIAFEFKIIHNNKNWRGKVGSIWIDLCDPPPGKLTKSLERGRRFGIVAIVFKTYPTWITEEGGYPGQIREENKDKWITEMKKYIMKCDQNKRLNIVQESCPINIEDPFLVGTNNTITFYLLKSEEC